MRLTKTDDMSVAGRASRISKLLSDSDTREECPECRASSFTVFITTDYIVSDAIWDEVTDRWRVGGTSLGNLKLKMIQCTACGWKSDKNAEKSTKTHEERPRKMRQIDVT